MIRCSGYLARERCRQRLHPGEFATFKNPERLLWRQILIPALVPTLVMPTFLPTFLLCRRRLLARTHQVHTALQRHRSILANGWPLWLLCGGVVAIDPLDSDLAQVVQTECTARGRPRRGTRHLCAKA